MPPGAVEAAPMIATEVTLSTAMGVQVSRGNTLAIPRRKGRRVWFQSIGHEAARGSKESKGVRQLGEQGKSGDGHSSAP